MFSYIHFSNMAISPQNNEKNIFILINCIGWQVWSNDDLTVIAIVSVIMIIIFKLN